MKKLMIEVAVNEYVTREEHPSVPLSEEEIAEQAVACASVGASVIHFHPRSNSNAVDIDRAQDVESYARTMSLIAARSDVLTYPTSAINDPMRDASVPVFPHVRVLRDGKDPRLETFAFFIGADNMGRWSAERGRWVQDRVTGLSHAAAVEFLSWCRDSGLKPQFGIREIGHLRHVEAYRRMGLIGAPVVLHLNLTSSDAFGLPPTAQGIVTMLQYVPPEWRAEWFVHNYHNSVNADPSDAEQHRLFNALAICMGGHVRTGIGDLPGWGDPQLENVQMVERFVAIAATVGRQVATPDESREMLGII